jgi:hypothetical protein
MFHVEQSPRLRWLHAGWSLWPALRSFPWRTRRIVVLVILAVLAEFGGPSPPTHAITAGDTANDACNTDRNATVFVSAGGCTGTLITPQIVVSAGHCLAHARPDRRVPKLPFETYGHSTDWERPDVWYPIEVSGQTIQIQFGEVLAPATSSCIPEAATTNFNVTHYSMPGNEDIVLFALENPVPATLARPARVKTSGSWSDLSSRTLIMAGWGGGATARKTATGRFNVAHPDEPNKFFVSGTSGAIAEGGDSGGPLYTQDSIGRLTLVGVLQAVGNKYTAPFGAGGPEDSGAVNPDLGAWFAERITSTIPATIVRTANAATFSAPTYSGDRLDWCAYSGRNCGKPAADIYCRLQGFREAISFTRAVSVGSSFVIGESRSCTAARCDGFASIRCEGNIVPAGLGLFFGNPGATQVSLAARLGSGWGGVGGFNFGPPFDYPDPPESRLRLAGDIDGDGWSDITRITGWGINVFSYTADPGWKTHVSLPHGTRLRPAGSSTVGHWALNANDRIEAAGDFDGDGDDEIVIRSNWGMSILDFRGGQLRPQVTIAHGTPIGPRSCMFDTTSRLVAVGDFVGGTANTDELILFGPDCLATIQRDGEELSSPQSAAIGDRIPDYSTGGHWAVGASDRILARGNFDGLPGDEFVIQSDWGFALIKAYGTGMRVLSAVRRGTIIDGFDFSSNPSFAGARRTGSRDQLVLAFTNRLAVLDFGGSPLTPRVTTRYDSAETVRDLVAVLDVDGDGSDELVVEAGSTWNLLKVVGTGMRVDQRLQDLVTYVGDLPSGDSSRACGASRRCWQFSLWDGLVKGMTPDGLNVFSARGRDALLIVKPVLVSRYIVTVTVSP